MKISQCPPPPIIYPDLKLIHEAVALIIGARKPLVIIGKGE